MARTKSVNDIRCDKNGMIRLVIWLSGDSPADITVVKRVNEFCIANSYSSKGAGLLELVKSGLEKEGY